MKEPKISVIVPVYNVEKYLPKCLDSILCQTFSNIEIICVNDGSTDNSRKILEEYKNKDSRIIIVDKKNGGLSSARNAGMKVAKGEFFSFIDSDDWIDSSMLEKLYKNITSLDTDISICAVHQFDETNQKIDDSNPYYTLEYFDSSFDNKSFSYKETKPFIMDVCVMAWNKLYRRSLIDKCKAEFPDGLIFEDGPFFFTIFFFAISPPCAKMAVKHINTKKIEALCQIMFSKKSSLIRSVFRIDLYFCHTFSAIFLHVAAQSFSICELTLPSLISSNNSVSAGFPS